MYRNLLPAKLCILFGCFLDEKIIGACLLRTSNKYAIYYRGVTLKEYRSYEPMDYLQWKSILWAKENDYLVYDLGGVSPNNEEEHGLWSYKSKWGGVPRLIPEYSTSLMFRMFSSVNNSSRRLYALKNFVKKNIMTV